MHSFCSGFYLEGVVPSLVPFSNRSACAPLNFALWRGAKWTQRVVFQKYERPSYPKVKVQTYTGAAQPLPTRTPISLPAFTQRLTNLLDKTLQKLQFSQCSLQKQGLVLQNPPRKQRSLTLTLIPAAGRSGFCRNYLNFNGDKLTSCQVKKYF